MTKSLERLFVWTGGALFVSSLGFCAYSYLSRWSLPAHGVSVARWPSPWYRRLDCSALALDAALFSAFALHHSVFARNRVKAWLAQRVPAHLIRSVYVWTASGLLVAVCLLWQPVGGELYAATGARAIVHACVQWFGLAVIAASVRTIDPLELAGIRSSQASGGLQTAGPYRAVRHPLYLGWILAVFGAAQMTGDRLAFAVLTALYLVIAMPLEERSLAREYGGAYERYKRQVPWRILPYIY
jgi:protein-S-isoprenylcysteine O-methyltransferase Ste14